MDGPVISMGGQISPSPRSAGAGELVKETDTAGFMADVIDASRQVPVIVDFWAPWCGPCKQLTPALERAVQAAGGKVRLVKVNVDQNQTLAAQMRIQSIPAVFAFVDGQPVDGFMGALPESELKAFIDRLGGQSGPEREIEDLLAAAREAQAQGDLAAAAQAYAGVLRLDRENLPAIAGLARCQVDSGDVEGARQTLALVPPGKEGDSDIAGVLAALELAETPADDEAIADARQRVEADPDDHAARHELAVALNAAGRREEALDHLLSIIKADRDWNDQAARTELLRFFEAWGPTNELTVKGRRRLSSLLFS